MLFNRNNDLMNSHDDLAETDDYLTRCIYRHLLVAGLEECQFKHANDHLMSKQRAGQSSEKCVKSKMRSFVRSDNTTRDDDTSVGQRQRIRSSSGGSRILAAMEKCAHSIVYKLNQLAVSSPSTSPPFVAV
jgi:hypothetical protein